MNGAAVVLILYFRREDYGVYELILGSNRNEKLKGKEQKTDPTNPIEINDDFIEFFILPWKIKVSWMAIA